MKEKLSPEDKKYLKILQSSCVNNEATKDIARRIKRAHELHENSYIWDTPEQTSGQYTRDLDGCYIEAFIDHPIPFIWYPLKLADYWGNDVDTWCDVILNDKEKEFFG